MLSPPLKLFLSIYFLFVVKYKTNENIFPFRPNPGLAGRGGWVGKGAPPLNGAITTHGPLKVWPFAKKNAHHNLHIPFLNARITLKHI